MMARVGKRKIGTWSYKQQRELIELAAASQSLETIANRMGRPTATILKKAAQLGISIKRQKAAHDLYRRPDLLRRSQVLARRGRQCRRLA
jgi:hypothetical protein